MVKLWQNFIRDYDGATYSILVGSEKYDYIHHKIRYLIGVKSGATDMVSHIYSKIKADSFHSLIKKKSNDFWKWYNTYYIGLGWRKKIRTSLIYFGKSFLWIV